MPQSLWDDIERQKIICAEKKIKEMEHLLDTAEYLIAIYKRRGCLYAKLYFDEKNSQNETAKLKCDEKR